MQGIILWVSICPLPSPSRSKSQRKDPSLPGFYCVHTAWEALSVSGTNIQTQSPYQPQGTQHTLHPQDLNPTWPQPGNEPGWQWEVEALTMKRFAQGLTVQKQGEMGLESTSLDSKFFFQHSVASHKHTHTHTHTYILRGEQICCFRLTLITMPIHVPAVTCTPGVTLMCAQVLTSLSERQRL